MNNIKELGIYVHIPFCVSKCAYCDFLSAPCKLEVHEEYVQALLKEIKAFAESRGSQYVVKSVFFGGGTPSIMDWSLTCDILQCIINEYNVKQDAEITIECNPGTVDLEKLKAYRNAGFNRLSFGLQSVNDDELKALGRIHSFEEFLESYVLAGQCGFDNINIDIMSALPGQTVESWIHTIQTVTRLRPAHISAYSLIVEEGTRLHEQVEQGLVKLPDEDTEREIYYATNKYLEMAGYGHYEISNYARAGRECRHNIIYWQGGEYAGFGLGAASYIHGVRYSNVRELQSYIANPLQDKCDVTVITPKDAMAEFMYLGLRMISGININEFRQRFGRHIDNVYGDVIDKYCRSKHMERNGDNIRLTQSGIDVSNVIFTDFIL